MMGIKEIQEIIPHRHPFLLIDCIEEVTPGEGAVGYKNVTYNEPWFAGHFPQEPVMPGVLIVEALAQVGAVAILSEEGNKGRTAYFGAINNAKFKKKVVPGDKLKLECQKRTGRHRKCDGNRRWQAGCFRRADVYDWLISEVE